MKDWRTETALYHVIEYSKSGREEYDMMATGSEIAQWCKTKEEFYGYVPGLGGDKNYSCVAWKVRPYTI